MHHKWERLAVILGQLHDWSLSLNCQQELSHEKVSEKEILYWIFCWEMPRMNLGVSWERKCLLNIVSQKLISYDFYTSFALQKVKWAFGGSKWKLRKLTRVSRLLAYVSLADEPIHKHSISYGLIIVLMRTYQLDWFQSKTFNNMSNYWISALLLYLPQKIQQYSSIAYCLPMSHGL